MSFLKASYSSQSCRNELVPPLLIYILDNLITNSIHAWLTKDYRSSGMIMSTCTVWGYHVGYRHNDHSFLNVKHEVKVNLDIKYRRIITVPHPDCCEFIGARRQSLFNTRACFYVIYSYVFSKWKSIRPVEISQYDITMATHDITMGNDVAMDAHVKSQWVMMLLGTSIVM